MRVASGLARRLDIARANDPLVIAVAMPSDQVIALVALMAGELHASRHGYAPARWPVEKKPPHTAAVVAALADADLAEIRALAGRNGVGLATITPRGLRVARELMAMHAQRGIG